MYRNEFLRGYLIRLAVFGFLNTFYAKCPCHSRPGSLDQEHGHRHMWLTSPDDVRKTMSPYKAMR